MGSVMDGEATPAQLAALLVALRMRGETTEELAGFAGAMRDRVVRVEAPPGTIDLVGTGGDGSGTFNISTAASLVVAAAGVPVAKHGNRAITSRSGSADVLDALGVRIDHDAASAGEALRRSGFAFLFAPSFHPAMRHAGPTRREIGVRTSFNLLGPLTNPAGATRQVLGVGDPAAAPRLAEVARLLGTERTLVVHGERMDELPLDGSGVVLDVTPAGIERGTIDAPTPRGPRARPRPDGRAGRRDARGERRPRRGGPRRLGRSPARRRPAQRRRRVRRRRHGGRPRDRDRARDGSRSRTAGPPTSSPGCARSGSPPRPSGPPSRSTPPRPRTGGRRHDDRDPQARRPTRPRAPGEASSRRSPPAGSPTSSRSSPGPRLPSVPVRRPWPRPRDPSPSRSPGPGSTSIAEVKRRSPSAGAIAGPGEDPIARARAYQRGGATAISVLCEPHWFGGSVADLAAIRAAVSVPVLAKEFVVDPRQLPLLRAAGADAVLLLAVLHPARRLAALVDAALDLGLEPLVEAHDGASSTARSRRGPASSG